MDAVESIGCVGVDVTGPSGTVMFKHEQNFTVKQNTVILLRQPSNQNNIFFKLLN